MADKRIHELDELTNPQSTDWFLMEQSSSNVDKKVKMQNLVPYDTMVSIITSILEAHPEWTTTVEDGSIDIDKLATDTLELINSKAETDGYYEDMAVGSAEQLLSNIFEDDTDPYLFRSTAGSKEVGDRVYEDAIVGASMPWNQLMDSDYYPTGTYSEVVVTKNNNILIANGTANGNAYIRIINSAYNPTTVSGHKYFVNVPTNADISYYDDSVARQYSNQTSAFMFSGSGAKISSFCRINSGVTVTNAPIWQQVTDLTLMFGSTIADYAYTLETSEAGSGIAWLKSQGFFTKDYYAYNTGGIESVKTSAKKVVGFNLLKDAFVRRKSWSNGVYTDANNSYAASPQIIRCNPNTVYNITLTKIQSDIMVYVTYFDGSGNYISKTSYIPVYLANKKVTFTTLANAYYFAINIYRNADIELTEIENININFHWDGERDGEYEPYKEHTYPLDSDLELRGIPKLVDGKIKYDGDLYVSDGTVTRKIKLASFTLAEATKGASADNTDAYTYNFSAVLYGSSGNNDNAVCIVGLERLNYEYNTADRTHYYFGAQNVVLYVPKDTPTSTTVHVIGTLATPTTETADPYINPQWIDNWGTEEYIDERDVPVPVGHDSRYLPDLKAKLESAPNNPSTNGKYFLQYENGQATYVPVPSEVPQTPSEDGTYVLKATVSGGTATLSWVAEE